MLAYEFGDGLAEAKAAVEKLGTTGGLDAAIAATYVALAQHDPQGREGPRPTARPSSPPPMRPRSTSRGRPRCSLGDYKNAISSLRSAHEKEPRPLYAVGLARAIAATGAWDEALAAVDSALGAMPDHPAALIERAFLLTASGRISAANPLTARGPRRS